LRIRDKICVLLSYKYNIKVFKRFEDSLALELSITASKSQIGTNAHQVFYEFLIFDRSNSNSSFRGNLKVLINILQNGRFRTLVQICNPFLKTADFYLVSRLKLIFIILKNFKLFRINMLDKFSVEYLDDELYRSYIVFPSTQMHSTSSINQFRSIDSFIMENEFTRPSKIKFELLNTTDFSIIDDFIKWNSYWFICFLRENRLEEELFSYLRAKYSLLLDHFLKFRVVEFLNHEMSEVNLDSIYESKGLKFSIPLYNVEIWHQRFIFADNKVLNLDATASPSLGFVAGIWPFIWKIGQKDSRYAILAPGDSPINLDAAIFLMGRVDENWYHFLLDTAPRLLFFEDVPSFVPILIRKDIPETSKEFLRSLTSREVIEIDVSDIVKVKMLYVLPGRSSIFDSHSPKGLKEIDFSPIVLKVFRNKVFESLSIESNGAPVKRISFNRKSITRSVVNWGKMCKVLNHFSFDDVPLDSKFFRYQVQIFSDSNIVVSPGGAVLANTIFMNPGSVVISLTSFRSQKTDLWRKLADAFDLKYADVKGIPLYWGFSYQRKLHSNFYVSPKKLRRILSREI